MDKPNENVREELISHPLPEIPLEFPPYAQIDVIHGFVVNLPGVRGYEWEDLHQVQLVSNQDDMCNLRHDMVADYTICVVIRAILSKLQLEENQAADDEAASEYIPLVNVKYAACRVMPIPLLRWFVQRTTDPLGNIPES